MVTGGPHPVAYRRGGPEFVVIGLLVVAAFATASACSYATVRQWREEGARRDGRSVRELRRIAELELERGPLEVRVCSLRFRLVREAP